MGANDFSDIVCGRNADEAFRKAVDQAAWDFGHAGYTGTLAEKYEFTEFRIPPALDTDPYILCEWATNSYNGVPDAAPTELHDLIQRMYKGSNDKWGPAGCFRLNPPMLARMKDMAWVGKPAEGENAYMFFGWASS